MCLQSLSEEKCMSFLMTGAALHAASLITVCVCGCVRVFVCVCVCVCV